MMLQSILSNTRSMRIAQDITYCLMQPVFDVHKFSRVGSILVFRRFVTVITLTEKNVSILLV